MVFLCLRQNEQFYHCGISDMLATYRLQHPGANDVSSTGPSVGRPFYALKNIHTNTRASRPLALADVSKFTLGD